MVSVDHWSVIPLPWNSWYRLMMLSDDHGQEHLTSFLDTLRGAMAAVKKRQSMISSNTTAAAGGTSAVPRSTSQPGNNRRGLISCCHFCARPGIDFGSLCFLLVIKMISCWVFHVYFYLQIEFYPQKKKRFSENLFKCISTNKSSYLNDIVDVTDTSLKETKAHLLQSSKDVGHGVQNMIVEVCSTSFQVQGHSVHEQLLANKRKPSRWCKDKWLKRSETLLSCQWSTITCQAEQ